LFPQVPGIRRQQVFFLALGTAHAWATKKSFGFVKKSIALDHGHVILSSL
jgi:hypothetical protein